jgi:hypothetical protein
MGIGIRGELYLLYGQANKRLAEQGITVGRNYVGDYCTSLDMTGASITLVELDVEIESLLVDPAEIPIRTFLVLITARRRAGHLRVAGSFNPPLKSNEITTAGLIL